MKSILYHPFKRLFLRLAGFLIFLCLAASGCQSDSNRTRESPHPANASAITGELIIFHAGSLSVPFKEIAAAFNNDYPNVHVLLEAGGSVANARKITDLDRPCDIIAVSDYKVIDQMLIPGYTDWNISFATNEMVIAFNEKSNDRGIIDSMNWFTILAKESVRFGRSDPNQDPCGYRTILTLLLAEKFYGITRLGQLLSAKDEQFIRPKEVDLLALLETHTVDYIFIYRSVAMQHQLRFIELPDEINLKEPALTGLYKTVSVDIKGRQPGESITMTGEPMLYSISVLSTAPHPDAAMVFAGFLLSEVGQAIMEKNGQPSVVPSPTHSYDQIPDKLRQYAVRGDD